MIKSLTTLMKWADRSERGRVRMRRKFLAVVSAALLLLCACGAENNTVSEKSLYEHGLDVISLMDEMVQSEDYGELMCSSSEIIEIGNEIAKGDYGEPTAVYRLEVNALAGWYELGEKDLSELSDTLRECIEQRYFSSIASQVNSRYGVTELAASSIYTAAKTFVSNELSEVTTYIYTYAHSYPVMVTFTPGEDGSVRAFGTFILDEDFKADEEQDIDMLLEDTSYIWGGKAEKLEIE